MYKYIQLIGIILSALTISCGSLNENIKNENSIDLSDYNLHLFNGTYKRRSTNDTLNVKGYDNSNLFRCLFLKPDKYGFTDNSHGDFVKMEVINSKKIRITLSKNGILEKSEIIKGKLINHTFEFKKQFALIPLLFLNFGETRKTRMELLKNGNIVVDTYYEAIANFLFSPWALNYYGYDLEFERIK